MVLASVMLGCVPAASATDVVFSTGSYVVSASSVALTMYDLENESPYASGTLRMELWAFNSPWTGVSSSVQSGYQLAVSADLGTLNADSHFTTDPITLTAACGVPPDGAYYVTLFLAEYQGGDYDDGFEDAHYVNFPTQLQVGQPGVSNGTFFGFSSAIYIGNGYYYDSDIGYMYSFNDGWVYVSNLNKYIYVNPGDEFTTGIYLYDLTENSWTYTEQSFWPYVYYFDGAGWVDTGLD